MGRKNNELKGGREQEINRGAEKGVIKGNIQEARRKTKGRGRW